MIDRLSVSADCSLNMRFEDDGGVETGAASYSWAWHKTTTTDVTSNDQSDSTIQLSTNLEATGVTNLHHIEVDLIKSGSTCNAIWKLFGTDTSGNMMLVNGTAKFNVVNEVVGVQFYPSTGSLESGAIRVYGLRVD